MGKPGGKRKIWSSKSTGYVGDNQPNAAKEVKAAASYVWNPGKSK